ncbi:unnamed protein product [Didymodactylos carnosus]|uniref:Uncharacterized protein n=1 Tax=Didymodactylos carnosus TaxID=1234261 RepID=A0A815KEF0_9BILA|nr:unnamed protein product [Didymodactylos carnosus]CAF1392199.1 unnamed protein product [Didymodactylos carnosus]CAF3795547.1 unnamed protein product [Didymodactylos carnosus]CAF4286682.1 unnamed protein product [Didymodactylos carnosus]
MNSDIVPVKKHTNWLTAAIIEELEYELPPQFNSSTHKHKSSSHKNSMNVYKKYASSKYFHPFLSSPNELLQLETQQQQTEPDILIQSIQQPNNVNNGYTASYWHALISKHAHISLSCLSVLTDIEHDMKFEYQSGTDHVFLIHG